MKCVCISCFDYYPTRMKSITEYFRSKGFDTTYVLTDFQHFSKLRYKATYDDAIQLHVPAYMKNMSISRLISHHNFAKKVYKTLCELRPDIIYCMFPPNSLVKQVIRYKRKYNTKVILDCYDMWPESFPYEKYEKLLSIPFNMWRRLRDDYIEEANLLVCVSNDGRDECKKHYSNIPLKVLLPSISIDDLPEYSFIPEESLSFCYLGNINHITDIELGIDLLRKIAEKRSTILHIIGEGQNIDEFVRGLEEYGVEVICHGVVFDTDIKRNIFGQCDFGLNIPREGIQSSMSLKSIEYMHAGLPFVNSGIGDNHDIVDVENIGININRDDIEDIVSTIMGITGEELKKMHENCINYYVEKFANQDLEELFKEIIRVERGKSIECFT